MPMKKMTSVISRHSRRVCLLAAGWTCVGLGVVGIFLPLLPTTPFLLAAAGCFAGSSPRLRDWLLRYPYLRHYMENYRSGGGVPVRTKVVSLVFLWGTLVISAFLNDALWYRGVLLTVGIAVSAHVLMLGTRKRNAKERNGSR